MLHLYLHRLRASGSKPNLPQQLEALEHAQALIDRGVYYNPDYTYINYMIAFAGTYVFKAMIGELSVEEACNQAQEEMEGYLSHK